MSAKQRVLLFRWFGRAARVMRRAADDELRHELTAAALGRVKSWRHLANADIDRLLAHLRVCADPDSLAARLAAANVGEKERERLIIGIERRLSAAALDEGYAPALAVDKFGEAMGAIGARRLGRADWRLLPLPMLRQLHLTVRERAGKHGLPQRRGDAEGLKKKVKL
ncbi:MAG: hypothetical protein LBK76_02500 [Verrucomicrobiales bacterium]|nr:hypothetical protein [Verrucomicrobiales bacterium]